ncbi:MAG: phosphoenolpyruvate--protein phosphotransferase [Alphaproteobacteria bacterium]|nr:phosphoenolpyruvate--protein phosphotransferase [Alphaproteobacteria bacterium]
MTTATVSGSRRVLRRMRSIMAASLPVQSRLDELVRVIAGEMVAEVCSIYVMRAGEVLELFATEGLNPDAVHQTRLRVGEGLVGTVAMNALPLNLPDAQAHPKFAYRPETGEEIYHSLLGVPILRGGRVRGVLVIQNRTQRLYSEEEVETLEVIAVVLAELIHGGDLIDRSEQVPAQGNAILPVRLTGISINEGIAIGEAVLHVPRVSIPQMFADDPASEHARLAHAVARMHRAIDDLFASSELSAGGEHREVLETYRSIAEDKGWMRRIAEAIDGGLTAEGAVQKVLDDTRTRMSAVSDPYLRERLYDWEDLANRLLQHLSGENRTAASEELPNDVVLIARNMGPAELLDYEPRRLRALVLEEGTPTSHVAIVARALDIPVVGQVESLLNRIDPNDPVIVDGSNALVYVRAGDDIHQMVVENIRLRDQRRARYRAMRSLPAVSRDGATVSLNLNAGLLMDLHNLEAFGAEGVGLYRTEVPFMLRSELPDVANQTDLYRGILDQAGGRPVKFRTLDVGGDKRLPYMRANVEENPAMGWRAIRMGLDRPSLLRQQLRALIAAAQGRELHVMFPMVTEVAEFAAARALIDRELAHAGARGQTPPSRVHVGAMLEVPGLIWQLDMLLPQLDFLSIGSNDLFQFLFASDRGNPLVAGRYDPLSPAVLAVLRMLVERCGKAGVPVSLCGEMAGRPLEAMTLVGLGLRELSMPPSMLGPVKAMVRSLDAGALRAYLDTLTEVPDRSLRERLRSFARDHGVVVEDFR